MYRYAHALVNAAVCTGMHMHLVRQQHGVGDLVLMWAFVQWKSVCTRKQQHCTIVPRTVQHCALPYRTGCNVGTDTGTSLVQAHRFPGG
jgi:hypothetical protein